jgi:hypothetical protein
MQRNIIGDIIQFFSGMSGIEPEDFIGLIEPAIHERASRIERPLHLE